MDAETKAFVSFSVFPGIGPVRFTLLVSYFGSAEKAWNAPVGELKHINLGEKLTEKFEHFRKTFDIDEYIAQLETLHVSVLTNTNPKYPKLLRQIPDAPFLLYILGKKTSQPIDMSRTIAIVGTRNITPYGRDITERLTRGLVECGFTIVSGMAYGVDAVAHKTALECGGKTIAVLGCGIDIIAPPSNAHLYHAIADGGGAIVSEMPLGLRPNKGLFPARNRIISGLSLGVVVTEGADDSGALITARNAGEQGREVFAVPGPVTSRYSKGPAKLLKNGATLVETTDDILDGLGVSIGQRRRVQANAYHAHSKEEQKILDALGEKRMQIDELIRYVNLTTNVVTATVTLLEMNGIIKDYGEKEYGLINN